MKTALYRCGSDWQEVEILEHRPDGVVLRETGKLWPGVMLATLDRVRLPGPVFYPDRHFKGAA